MSAEETLHDVNIREQQLEAFILHSPEYLQARRPGIEAAGLDALSGHRAFADLPGLLHLKAPACFRCSEMMLVSVTSLLAIINCLLLIQTKTWLHRLNEAWLGPQEKVAITSLRSQRQEIMTRMASAPSEETANAALN